MKYLLFLFTICIFLNIQSCKSQNGTIMTVVGSGARMLNNMNENTFPTEAQETINDLLKNYFKDDILLFISKQDTQIFLSETIKQASNITVIGNKDTIFQYVNTTLLPTSMDYISSMLNGPNFSKASICDGKFSGFAYRACEVVPESWFASLKQVVINSFRNYSSTELSHIFKDKILEDFVYVNVSHAIDNIAVPNILNYTKEFIQNDAFSDKIGIAVHELVQRNFKLITSVWDIIINTVFGSHVNVQNDDFSFASLLDLPLGDPVGLVYNKFDRNLYLSDMLRHTIHQINTINNTMKTIGGNFDFVFGNFSADGTLFQNSSLFCPGIIRLDSRNNMFFLLTASSTIRKVDAITNKLTTVIGLPNNSFRFGKVGNFAENISASKAQLRYPYDFSFDSKDNMYIADTENYCIRVVNITTNIIKTFAGKCGLQGNGSQIVNGKNATDITLGAIFGMNVDGNDNVIIADVENHCVLKIDERKIVSVFAGKCGIKNMHDTIISGMNANDTYISSPTAIGIDSKDNIFVGGWSNTIIKIDAKTNILTLIAGKYEKSGFFGDFGSSKNSIVTDIRSITFDYFDNLYFTDSGNGRIRVIINCPPGTYYSKFTCIQSSVDHFSNYGSNLQFPCSVGSFSNIPGSSNCTCGVGYHSQSGYSTNDEVCQQCEKGTFANHNGTVICSSCSDGYISTRASTICTPCSSSTYSNLEHTNCEVCPENSFSKQGFNKTGCLCNPGYANSDGHSANQNCTTCPPGKYSDLYGSTTCVDCLNGTYSGKGSNSCKQCISGTYSSLNKSECVDCERGFKCIDGLRTECQPLEYSDLKQSYCSFCIPGFKCSSLHGPIPCGPNTYNDGSFPTCKPCSLGEYSFQRSSFCSRCPAGKKCEFGQAPKNCSQGTFCPSGTVNETDCAKGYFCATPESQEKCSPGNLCSIKSISPTACPKGFYCINPSDDKPLPCPKGRYNDKDNATAVAFCIDCKQFNNKTTLSDGTNDLSGCICPIGTYTWNNNCITCPIGIICLIENLKFDQLQFEPGYFPSNITGGSIELQHCNNDACSGGNVSYIQNNNNSISMCSSPYKGFLCSSCDDQHYQTNAIGEPTKCGACNGNSLKSTLYLFATGILGLIIIGIQIYSNLNSNYEISTTDDDDSATNSSSSKKNSSGYLKLILNHLQVISLVGQMSFKWPNTVRDLFFGSISFFSSGGSSVSSLGEFSSGIRCNLYSPFIPVPMNSILVNIYALIFNISVISIILILVKRKEFINSSTVIICFNAYPNILKSWFQLFNCYTFGNNSSTHLQGSLDILCYSTEHKIWIFALGLPVAVIVIFGFPTIAFVKLFRERQKYGFLFRGYKSEFWFWEILLLLKKIMLSCISVFISSKDFSNDVSNYNQALLAILVFIIFLCLQLYYQPFIEMESNEMEIFGLGVGLLTLYCGMWTYGSSTVTSILVTIVVIGVNILWVIVMIAKVRRKTISLYNENKHKLEKIKNLFYISSNKEEQEMTTITNSNQKSEPNYVINPLAKIKNKKQKNK